MPNVPKSDVISNISNVDVNIQQLEINSLIPFEHHPFQVSMDSDMVELIERISAYGIINPIIVRPYQKEKFQILSGHRRTEACKQLKALENIAVELQFWGMGKVVE
jgi:ParB family chromosome partitioning protein